MEMCKNRQFIDSCTKLLPKGGSYGEVKFLANNKGNIFVEKKCKRDEFFDLAITTKEAFFMQYLNDDEKESFVPKLATRKISQMNKCIVYRTITMQFVGPSLHECNVLGFFVKPAWLLHQLMKACHFLERKGVMHLEIKSNNVTYDLNANKIKLIDFGLSEFCLFHDLEREGGIKQIHKGNQVLVGRVTPNGFISKYQAPGSVYMQSQFLRCESGVSRISTHTNSPPYRQLESIICQWFGIEQGLQIDAKFDVFSAAWTVLTHMIGFEQHIPDYETDLQLERKRLGRSIYEILPSLLSYRGNCESNEVYALVTTIKHAMASLGMNLFETQKRIGQLKAVETLLKLGPNEGSLTGLSHIYGNNFVKALQAALHPVKAFRHSSLEVMSKLCEDENIKCEDGSVDCVTYLIKERYVTGRVMKENFCIASLTIDIVNNRVLWSYLDALKQLKKADLIWNQMLIQIHSKSCCLHDLHGEQWYSMLDKNQRLNMF